MSDSARRIVAAVIDARDDVATALGAIDAGSEVTLGGVGAGAMRAVDAIASGHKLALHAIARGASLSRLWTCTHWAAALYFVARPITSP
ncbi:MAG: hypothetical protein ACHQJ7_11505 [Vicinamibacteria bacterium]